jgi:hypothetical protein
MSDEKLLDTKGSEITRVSCFVQKLLYILHCVQGSNLMELNKNKTLVLWNNSSSLIHTCTCIVPISASVFMKIGIP